MNEYEQRQEDRKARMMARADRMEALAEARERAGKQTADSIPLGQPMLVGHHSYKADRNRRERMQRNFQKAHELRKKAADLRSRAAGVGTAGIASDDPDAPEALRARIETLEAKRARMVDINKLYRAGKAGLLKERYGLDLTELRAQVAAVGYSWVKAPFESYQMQNLGANIRRLNQRLEDLERMQKRESIDERGPGWHLYEDAEAGRICLEHSERLPREHPLRRHMGGFCWSRANGRWQRKLTPNAVASVRACLLPALRRDTVEQLKDSFADSIADLKHRHESAGFQVQPIRERGLTK